MTDAPPPIPPEPSLVVTEFSTPERTEIEPFQEQAGVATTEVVRPSIDLVERDGPPRWYLGIFESAAWFMGTLVVHLVGGVSVLILLIVYETIKTGKPPAVTSDPTTMLIVTAYEMLIFVLCAMLAFTVRYWGRTANELNFSCPDLRHVAIVIGATLPLSFCVSAWSIPIQYGWQYVVEQYPWLKVLDGMNVMETIKEMAQATSFPLMILIVAVLPAVGEELVFRGAIGRILIGHIGLWSGVILTSFLFGCIHIHPVHALSVMPLGLAMHLIYLWTRSFWMPMVLHFLNNSWATLTARLGTDDGLHDAMHPSALEWIEMATAVFAVIFLAIALWQTRVRYYRPDGIEWSSSRFPIRVPPSVTIRRVSNPANSICWYTAIACVVVCHSMVAFDLISAQVAAN